MTAAYEFTDRDRERFSVLKAELGQRLPRPLKSSEDVHACARILSEIRRLGYHHLDQVDDCLSWMDRFFHIGDHQANKYFQIAANLTAAEVVGLTLGVEALYQLALAPGELRPRMRELAERDGLSAGALAAGRLKAVTALEEQGMGEALKVLVQQALKQAAKEDREREERKAKLAQPEEQLVRGLAREASRLQNILTGDTLPDAAMRAKIHAGIARLIELDVQLTNLEASAQAGPVGTSQTSATGTSETSATGTLQTSATGTFQTSEFLPLAAAARHLDPVVAEKVREDLGRIIRGDPPDRVLPRLRVRLLPHLSPGGPETRLLERGLQLLGGPDRVARGLLGLDWLAEFGLPGVDRKLKVLSLLDLPDELQKKVSLLKAGAARPEAAQAQPAQPPGG